jgi:biotin carboxyl carrier protein
MAIHQVRAPLPGVFYRRPAPDEPPLKSEGERVAVGERIALVEAMKSFFPVEATNNGHLIRFSVTDGAPVDADDVVAEIES